MSNAEWESLCDGCARCCLEKLEDEDTGKIYFTHVSCKLLDAGLCACKDYPNRSDKVPDCVRLTPENVRTLNWLPPSCGYKLVAEGRDLYWWHPLISGDPNTVHEAGVSVRGRVQGTEDEIAGRRSRGPHRAMAGAVAEAGAAEEAALIAHGPAEATCAFPFGRQRAMVVAYLKTGSLKLCSRFRFSVSEIFRQ